MEDNVKAKAPRKRTPTAVDKPETELPSLTELDLEAQQQIEPPAGYREIGNTGVFISGANL